MTRTQTVLQGAQLIDFTGKHAGYKHFTQFGPEFVSHFRQTKPSTIVVIDGAVGMPLEGPVTVQDHLNLTGTSPLLGPNDPSGERFPVVQGIYITDDVLGLPSVVVAGLKLGQKLSSDDVAFLKSMNVGAACYNITSAMLIAAHAKCRVLGILVPDGAILPADLLNKITELVGETK